MSQSERLPDYNELPIKPEYPPHSAWGVFGKDDQIGTLNLQRIGKDCGFKPATSCCCGQAGSNGTARSMQSGENNLLILAV